jgi:hypothetical protein
MLLDAVGVQRILNTPTLTPQSLRTAMTDEPEQASDPCAPISVPVGGSYHDSGVTASTSGEMTADVGTRRLWLNESVVAFKTPDAAADFMARAQHDWPACGGHMVTVARGGPPEPRKLQGAFQQDNILVMDDTALAGPASDCSHSIAAISNVVIDVAVCGAQKPLAAGSIPVEHERLMATGRVRLVRRVRGRRPGREWARSNSTHVYSPLPAPGPQ